MTHRKISGAEDHYFKRSKPDSERKTLHAIT